MESAGTQLPKRIICDIDGTVALRNGRGPYDWNLVGEDVPNEEVCLLVRRMQNWTPMVFVSGRMETPSCRRQTEFWLNAQGLVTPDTSLFMRPEGDFRADNLVKQQIYEEKIAGVYDIIFVIDDRDQVVRMWRSIPLTCLQVAEGNF